MLKNNMIIGFRNIRKNKAHSLTNILCLALGMACCILMMFWIDNDLQYDNFHENLDHLFRVETVETKNGQKSYIDLKTSYPVADALKAKFPEVADSTRILGVGERVFQRGRHIYRESSMVLVAPSFFNLFTFNFIRGDAARPFTNPNSIVLTRGLAAKYFGDEDPMGKMITIDQKYQVQVSAVIEDIPANTHFNDFYPGNCFAPMNLQKYYLTPMTGWDESYLVTYVLLKKGTDFRQFNQKITGYLGEKHPVPKKYGYDLMLHPVEHIRLFGVNGENTGINTIYLYSILAVIILLVACVNYINLATAFSLKRAREIGIRKVLGTGRKGIIYQFLCESALVSLGALLLAVTLVAMAFPFFNSMIGQTIQFTFNSLMSYLPYFLLLALVTAFLAGIFPAFYISGLQPIRVLKGEKGKGIGTVVLRRVLVTLQIIFSTLFLTGTLVVLSQFNFMVKTSIGINKKDIVCMDRGTIDRGKFDVFKRAILNHQMVAEVGAAAVVPGYSTSFAFRDARYQGQSLGSSPLIHGLYVGYDFFRTLSIPLIKGETFSPELNNPQGIILNKMAADLLSDREPVGKIFEFEGEKYKIMGVVKTFPIWPFKFSMYPTVALFNPGESGYVFIKLKKQAGVAQSGVLRFIEQQWREHFPRYPFDYSFLEDLDRSLYRKETRLLKIFGNLALLVILISCLGIYGLISYIIQGRLKEISIRKVLGADLRHLMAGISRGLFQSIIIANLIAMPLGWILMNRWLQNYTYRINLDPGLFLLGALLSLALALTPVSPHILRIHKLQPAKFLREE